MTEPDEQDLPTREPEKVTISPTSSPALPQKNGNALPLPLLIVGLITLGLLCVIGLISVPAFFIILNAEGNPAEVVGTVVISEESSVADDSATNGTTASGDIIFEDTFDSNINGWETGTIEGELGVEDVAIADGVYTLRVAANGATYVEKELPNQEFSDFVLTLDITPGDREEYYSYGVTFRQNENLESYVIELGNDGLYAVFLFTDEWMILEDWTFSEAIIAGETNELTISAKDNRLTFLVNGQPLTTVEDNTLSKGKIGLVVEIFEEGQSATIDFDNLVIRKP